MTGAQDATAATVGGARGSALFEGSGWPMIVFIWVAFVVATAAGSFSGAIEALTTDDAMRLVQARDLIAGQSWFDLIQHRLNPPDGVAMHWSRLIDLPIAVLLWTVERLLAPDLALNFLLTLWPALLMLPALFAAASAARTIAGPAAGVLAAFMLVLTPAVTARFAPGAIDHHGAQIALALTLLACALRLDRSTGAAIGAGLAAAAMMAIGMETAPHVAVCAALVAVRWGFEGRPMARGACLFGLSFATGTFALAVLTIPPSAWIAPVCDAIGSGHLALAGIGGAGLALATRFSVDSLFARFAALAQIAAAAFAGIAIAAPNCLSSPYGALPEKLQTDWLARVQEAQGMAAVATGTPTMALALGLPLVVLVAVAVWALSTAERERRWQVATAAAMCAAAVAVTVWQIRGASLGFALGAPLLPIAVIAIGATGDRIRSILAVMALSPATLSLAGLGLAQAAGLPTIESETKAIANCPSADYRALDRYAPGLALNTIDTGPSILAFSKHRAVAAPYHRNVDGMMAEIGAFEGSEETARATAVSRRATYVVVCPGDGGVSYYARRYPDGFSALLMSDKAPDWLAPVDLGPGATLRAWRVLAGR